jgi:hypothetical protein
MPGRGGARPLSQKYELKLRLLAQDETYHALTRQATRIRIGIDEKSRRAASRKILCSKSWGRTGSIIVMGASKIQVKYACAT